MQARWTSHLSTTEEKESFKKRLYSVSDVLEVLDHLLDAQECKVEIVREADYDSPSWACKQADKNGYIRAIREVRRLLQLSDND